MRLLPRLIACTALLAATAPALAGMQCFENQKITRISTGYGEGSLGADHGDAVYFKITDGRQFPLNNGFNLDWPRGQALHRVLLLAMVGGYRITGYDHFGWGGTCDDVDEIVIVP